MTAHARTLAQRRGACPGLSAPMPTGDGLLVRLMPVGTIVLAAFEKLCAAARAHGNGIVEITARGNIQVRGFTPASVPRFAAFVAGLGIAAEDGIPILSNPLTGIDPEEILDAGALAAAARRTLARGSLAASLAPKVSVVIDGGGSLDLDALAADVRLCAETMNGGPALRVSVGGERATAVQLGLVLPAHGVETAARLLTFIARQGRDARARDIVAAEGVAGFRSAIAGLLVVDAQTGLARSAGDVIGMHRLRDGTLACGVGLAFSHSDAASLERLAEAAAAAGARGVRAVAGRALMAIGLAPQAATSFAAGAERLGFIVRADDPRRHVIACAGAPICAAAAIAARAIGPVVAKTAAPHIDGSFKIHISGCAKGCAHPAPAALTIVGTPGGCALVVDGTARDVPRAVVATDELPAAIAKLAHERKREAGHG